MGSIKKSPERETMIGFSGLVLTVVLVTLNPIEPRGPKVKKPEVVPSSPHCPSGWSEFQGKCYKYFPEQITWFDARDNCLALEADLASIYSQEENNFVSGLAEGKIAWLGGYRYQVCPLDPYSYSYTTTSTPNNPNGPGGPISSNPACQCYGCGFLWTDGTPMNYNATFAPGQPDNKDGSEFCLDTNFGGIDSAYNPFGLWNDDGCYREDRGRYVCKKSMS